MGENVTAIIQARMGSTRFPGKVMKKIGEKSLLGIILFRLSKSTFINKIVLATTQEAADDVLAIWAARTGIGCFRGSTDDVLERFYKAATEFDSDIIVRVTADDPFKDPEVIDRAIRLLLEKRVDYCSNTILPTFPEGLDIEVFTREALNKAAENATSASDREHVTPYIWRNTDLFKSHNFLSEIDFSAYSLTVDTKREFQLADRLFQALNYDYGGSYLTLMKFLVTSKKKNEFRRTERNVAYNEQLRRGL